MELELCLALPCRCSAPSSKVVLGFDLNGDACATPAAAVHNKKRAFVDAFCAAEDAIVTLPLLDNNNNNNNKEGDKCNGAGGGGLVGWPPVKAAWRSSGGGARYVKVKMEGEAIGRKLDLSLHRSYATLLHALDRLFTRNHEEAGQVVGLGRDGPPPLPAQLHRTFTYEDSDGDWMLLGDVPWETFVKSVKRLKIRSCGE